ncbi:MAG: hypothetical protein FJ128_00185 [Deltaproteobacteria bacterium]|nr:hypothetical protein [Deltaproteobacteria bacterium]
MPRSNFPWSGLGLAVVLLVALCLRLPGLNAESLSSDELFIVDHALGVLKSGYPHRSLSGFEYRLFTYELVPYPLAVVLGFFGLQEGSLRLVSLLWGLAATALLYLAGRRLWDGLTGFVAALIYACSPWAVCWSQNLFHPAQDQFMAFLTMYLFYRGAIQSPDLNRPYLVAAGAAFPLTYLSWEGTGFLLPAFLLSLFVFRRQNWNWMKSGVLWGIALTALVVVFLEMCWRLTAIPSYLLVGEELNYSTTPMSAFLLPDHDFWFFWRQFLWGENRALLSAAALAGLPLAWRDRALAYFLVLTGTVLFLLTFFMEHLISHYFYFLFPGLILAAARTLLTYLRWAGELAALRAPWLRVGLAGAVLALFLAGANSLGLNLQRLPYPSEDEPFHERRNYAWIDFRGADRFLLQNHPPGEILSTNALHLHLFHRVVSPLATQERPMVTEFIDFRSQPAVFREKYTGARVLKSRRELEEAFCRHPRLYLTLNAYRRLADADPLFWSWLQSRCTNLFFSYDTAVMLWHR